MLAVRLFVLSFVAAGVAFVALCHVGWSGCLDTGKIPSERFQGAPPTETSVGSQMWRSVSHYARVNGESPLVFEGIRFGTGDCPVPPRKGLVSIFQLEWFAAATGQPQAAETMYLELRATRPRVLQLMMNVAAIETIVEWFALRVLLVWVAWAKILRPLVRCLVVLVLLVGALHLAAFVLPLLSPAYISEHQSSYLVDMLQRCCFYFWLSLASFARSVLSACEPLLHRLHRALAH